MFVTSACAIVCPLGSHRPPLRPALQVDPSTIPHRRLKKAVQIRETDLRAVTVDALGRIHVATAKLFR